MYSCIHKEASKGSSPCHYTISGDENQTNQRKPGPGMASNLPAIPQFDANSDPSSLATRWKEWRKQFNFYAEAVAIKDKKQKRALLLHLSGPTVQKVFRGLSDTGDDFDTAVAKLDEYFSPKKTLGTNTTISNRHANNKANPSTSLRHGYACWLKAASFTT